MGYVNNYRKGKYFSYPVRILESWENEGETFYRIQLAEQKAVAKEGAYFNVENGEDSVEKRVSILEEFREEN